MLYLQCITRGRHFTCRRVTSYHRERRLPSPSHVAGFGRTDRTIGRKMTRPAHFVQELWGCAVELHYPVLKLLDGRTKDDELAASVNPFAVVVRA